MVLEVSAVFRLGETARLARLLVVALATVVPRCAQAEGWMVGWRSQADLALGEGVTAVAVAVGNVVQPWLRVGLAVSVGLALKGLHRHSRPRGRTALTYAGDLGDWDGLPFLHNPAIASRPCRSLARLALGLELERKGGLLVEWEAREARLWVVGPLPASGLASASALLAEAFAGAGWLCGNRHTR